MSVVLAVLSGGVLAGGLLLLATGLFGQAAPPVTRPPSRVAEALKRPLRRGSRRRFAVAAAAGLLVLVVTGWIAAAVAGAAAVLWLPRVMSGRAVTRRLERLDAIEQWVRKLGGLLGASHGLEDALVASVRHAPEAIRPEIEQLAARLNAGMSASSAAYRLAGDLDDPVGDLVVGALVQAAEVRGRGLQALLTDLAAMVAADVAGRREVEAARAPHRTTVRGLAIIFGVFGIALIWRHDYSAAYDTPVGQVVLAVLLGICGVGLFTMHRLATQAPVSRFLSAPERQATTTASAAGSGTEVRS